MTWINASLRGVAIVVYFVFTLVWLPDFALDLVKSASWFIQDTVVVGVWAVGLGAGLLGLRMAQRRGLI